MEEEMTMNNNFEKAFYTKIHDKMYRVLLSITSSITRSILILIPIFLMRNIYNTMQVDSDRSGVFTVIMLTFILPIIVAASYSLDIRLSKYIFVIIKDIQVQTLHNIIKLKLRTILTLNRSDLFNRIIVSLEELGEFYYYFINTSTWYITTTVVGIGFMLYINFQITIVLLAFVLMQICCSLIIQKRIEKAKELENQLQAQGSDYLIHIMAHNSFIKTALLGDSEMNNAVEWIKQSWKMKKAVIINNQIVAVLSFLLTLMRTLYLLFSAHYLFLSKSMLKGDFITLNSYIVWLTPVFLGLQESVQDIITSRANKRRVNAYLEDEISENSLSCTIPDSVLTCMEVYNLSFRYEGAKNELFSDISFKVNAGETLFIVGASGSGKSTLLNILINLEANYGGLITHNNCDLKCIDDKWLHQNVIMVGQDVDILPTTLRDNLAYSGIQVSDDEIIQTLHSLKIGYLLEMPGALDWDMKVNPRSLSDGEKKRIAIARAILSKPQALFLDEPTAGLDNINKMDVARFIESRIEGLLVIVTHDNIFTNDSCILDMNTYAIPLLS